MSGIPPGTYLGSIRDLATLQERCVIDEDTGCWHMRDPRGRPMPRNLQHVVWVYGMGQMTATRAAWSLAGHEAPKGYRVFRTCPSYDCVCPDHLRCGTGKQHGATMRRLGVLRGDPRRALINRRNRARATVVTPELRIWIVESDQSCAAIAHSIGVSQSCVSAIRRGSRQAVSKAVPSVFHLGAMA